MTVEHELKQLRWQCRRGTKELDFLLLAYLDQCYSTANAIEQQSFKQLLVLEDSFLIHNLLSDQVVHQAEWADLVAKIRSLSIKGCSLSLTS